MCIAAGNRSTASRVQSKNVGSSYSTKRDPLLHIPVSTGKLDTDVLMSAEVSSVMYCTTW